MGDPTEPGSSHAQPLTSGADAAGSEKYSKDLSGEPWDEFAFWLEVFRASILDFCVTRALTKDHPEINAHFLGGNILILTSGLTTTGWKRLVPGWLG